MGKIKKTLIRAARAIEKVPDSVGGELHSAVNAAMPERHDPRILAKGGEHLVFRFNAPFRRTLTEAEVAGGKKARERQREVVYKINYYDTLPVLAAKVKGNDVALQRALDKMREKIEDKRHALKELRSYFGFAAVPVQQYQIREVPVTRDVLAALKLEVPLESDEISVPAWVEVQRRVDLAAGETEQIRGYYPEAPKAGLRRSLDERDSFEIFTSGHQVLTGGLASELDEESQTMYALAIYPDLLPLARRARQDKEFRKELMLLSEKLMDFIEDTGIALDFAGHENAVMLKRGGKWGIKFLDILGPGDYSFSVLKMILEDMRQGKPLGERARIVALNLVNTVRVANALALVSGNPRRLHYPDLAAIPPETWFKQMQGCFKKP